MGGINLYLYDNRRNCIINEIEKISEIADLIKNKAIKENCMKYKHDLLEDRFNIVVVGEFSRGKSMFINALMGKKILPSSTKPTTAILNRISYNSEEKYEILYRDESTETISKETFKEIVAPKEPYEGDLESEKKYEEAVKKIQTIETANIGYPLELCKNGIELVDTPGTNDLDAAREEITYKFIPKSDVVILLLSAQQILTESEMSFLKDRIIKEDIKKIFFVINFKDRIKTEESQQKIIQYAKEHLKDVVQDIKIFMVSAKGALNYKRSLNNEKVKGEILPIESTGFIELEENLSKYLSIEAGRGKLLKYINKIKREIRDLNNNSIKLAEASLNMSSEEVEKKVNNLKSEISKVKVKSNNELKNLKLQLVNSQLDLSRKLRRDLERIANVAEQAVDSYEGEISGRLIAKHIEGIVAPIQTQLQSEMNKLQEETINSRVALTNKKLGEEWNNFGSIMDNEFNITSSNVFIDVEEDDEEFTSIKTHFGYAGMCIGLLAINASAIIALPALIFGHSLIGKFIKDRNREKSLNKVKEQMKSRYRNPIPNTIDNFKKEWEKTVDSVVSEIEQGVNNKIKSLEDNLNNINEERRREQLKINDKKRNLRDMVDRLTLINQNLDKLSNEINF